MNESNSKMEEIITPTNDSPRTKRKDNCDKRERWSENSNAQQELTGLSRETMCGIGLWRPLWLQRLANHNVYTASFVIIGIVQGMIYAYFNGTITTVEKVFGISSRVMGILLTGNDVSQILCGMLVTHYGGKGSRPLWIAFGMVLTAASCFIYGSCQLLWDGNINSANEIGVNQSLSKTSMLGMCLASSENTETLLESESTACNLQHSNVPSMLLFFFGQFISGVGSTALFSLGFTYMDDNIKKRHSPLYIGMSVSLRSFGPSLGYILASFCLRIYINPNEKPKYSIEDPRWLGAWWLGFLIIGLVQLLITFPMLLFPKHLPSERRRSVPINDVKSLEKLESSKVSPLKDFMLSLKRLLKNPIMVFNLASTAPVMFAVVGISTFMPKYLEAQFGQSASRANIFTGMSGMLMMMVGTFTGGFLIWKFKPRTIYITGWNAFVNIFFVVSVIIVMGLYCNDAKFSGIEVQNNKLEVTSTCSQNCNCELRFDPICVHGQNFLSPCLAGCTELNQTLASKKMFSNCTCAQLESDNGQGTATATSGYCPNTRGTCNMFYVYILVLGVTKLISATSRVGSVIIFIRCVKKRDKALAMALMSVTASIFGFIPGPIIFGIIADSTCLLWEKTTCGKRGNCWLYNVDQLRYWFHGLMAVCFIISFVFDVLVCIYSRFLNLYDEDCPEITTTYKNKKKTPLSVSNRESCKLVKLTAQETKSL